MSVTSNKPLHSVTLIGTAAQQGAHRAKANTATSQCFALGERCNTDSSWCSAGRLRVVAFRRDPECANTKLIKELSLGALLCGPKPAPGLHNLFPAGCCCCSILPFQLTFTKASRPWVLRGAPLTQVGTELWQLHLGLLWGSGETIWVQSKERRCYIIRGLEQRNHNAWFIGFCLH